MESICLYGERSRYISSSPVQKIMIVNDEFFEHLFDDIDSSSSDPLPGSSCNLKLEEESLIVGLKRKEREFVEKVSKKTLPATKTNNKKRIGSRDKYAALLSKERNRDRERNRRAILKNAMDDCAAFLPPHKKNRCYLKREILTGCASLIEEADEIADMVDRSYEEVLLSQKQKQVVEECVAALMA